tara:strand:+ start:630 stop:860 length:231 start_codon:yes stop_codon:yes gene_type:complete
MKEKFKKNFSKNKLAISFREIDVNLLIGWECTESSKKQKDFLESLKSQTKAAMENKKFNAKRFQENFLTKNIKGKS